MIYEADFQKTIESAFLSYAASVAQERSIPDVRDGLKIGLRQGLYAQYSNKLTYKDKFQKAQKSVAAAMAQSYVHGDLAMYDTLIRAAKPWVYRYPIEAVQGSYGDPRKPDNHSASRYVEMKAGEISNYFFAGLKKNAIDDWYSNYDDTEMIPSVFPTIGFWNIVNGSNGIAVAMATSIPQFNLKEVNTSLIKLIKNADEPFENIYCAPDFAQGGIIINEREVKESLIKGEGAAIKIRAKIVYHADQNMLQATEMPFGVFTKMVCDQLIELANTKENYGIERVVDHTKKTADIRIYLSKNVNPEKMIAKIYKDTSLENSFAVNMIMLDQGRFPRVFGWREACLAYITHIRACKRREIEFDLAKAQERLNIVEGLLTAAASIDEVVALIRSSDSPAEASKKLIDRFSFNAEQVKAILAMKLSSLTRIDGIKLKEEKEQLISKIAQFQYLLKEPQLLDAELIKTLQEVADKFGDARRTKVMNLVENEKEQEEEQYWTVNYCDSNTLVVTEEKEKIRFSKKLKPVQTIYTSNFSSLFFITNKGRYYNVPMKNIGLGQHDFNSLYGSQTDEYPILLATSQDLSAAKTLILITKEGMVKRSVTSEYCGGRVKGANALKLRDTDSLIGAYLSNSDKDSLIVISNVGRYNHYPVSEISETGKITLGVKAIKLEDKESIAATTLLKESNTCIELVCIKPSGATEKITVPPITSRGIKGSTLTSLVCGIAPVPLNVTSITLLQNGKIQKI